LSDTIPPLSGIARKSRSDKGTTRKTGLDGVCDWFMGQSTEAQQAAINVLEALHRQVLRGAIKPAPEAKEDDND
jgi:hypothetical protein